MGADQLTTRRDVLSNAIHIAVASKQQEKMQFSQLIIDDSENVLYNIIYIDLHNLIIPNSVKYIKTTGYYRPEDGGSSILYRVFEEPDHPGKVQSRDGAWWELNSLCVTPLMFGAIGDGITDDTLAVSSTFLYANRFMRNGLAEHIKHPGATVELRSYKYLLASLKNPIIITCNLNSNGADFLVSKDYAGEVVRVGLDSSPYTISDAHIALPSIYKETRSKILLGSTGVRIANCNACRIYFNRVDYFDTNIHMGGIGEGTVYCDIHLGQSSYGNTHILVAPGPNGWFNRNNLYSGKLRMGGDSVSNTVQLKLDGQSPAHAIVGNNFIGLSMEGHGAEYLIHIINSYGNTFFGCYHESGAVEKTAVCHGANIIAPSHFLREGDMILFSATVLPTNIKVLTPYFIVKVISKDKIQVSSSRGGLPLDLSDLPLPINYIRMARMLFDGKNGLCKNNKFINTFTPPSNFISFQNINGAYNNSDIGPESIEISSARQDDAPVIRVANKHKSSKQRPLIASYPAKVNPFDDPHGWTTALSDNGILFASQGIQTGHLYSEGDALIYQAGRSDKAIQIFAGNIYKFDINEDIFIRPGKEHVLNFLTENTLAGCVLLPLLSNSLPEGILVASASIASPYELQCRLFNCQDKQININNISLSFMAIKSN